MPVLAKRYTIKFEDSDLCFSETYPPGLEGILSVVEFDSVIRKINGDMTLDIREAGKMVRKWAIVSLSLCLVIIGFALTPVVLVKLSKQKRELRRFWECLRVYFGEINRKTFMKRNLEWKLVEDKKQLKGRDVVNPLFAYRIEIIHRKPRAARPRTASALTTTVMRGDASTVSTMDSSTYSPRMSTVSEGSTGKHFPSLAEENELEGYEYEEDAREESIRDEDIILPGVAPLLASVREEDEFLEVEEEGQEEAGFEEPPSGTEEECDYYASASSVGASSYGRTSIISASMAAAVATSLEQIRQSALRAEAKEAQAKIDTEAVLEAETPEKAAANTDEEAARTSGKRHSHVRFSGIILQPGEPEMKDRSETEEMTEQQFPESDEPALSPHKGGTQSTEGGTSPRAGEGKEILSPPAKGLGLFSSIILPQPTSPSPPLADTMLMGEGQERGKDATGSQEDDFIIIPTRGTSPTEEHKPRIEEEAAAREEEFLIVGATLEEQIGSNVPSTVGEEKRPSSGGAETSLVAFDEGEATDAKKEGERVEHDEAPLTASGGEEEPVGSITETGSSATSYGDSFFFTLPTVEEYETEKPLPPLPPSSGSEAGSHPSAQAPDTESLDDGIASRLTPPPSPKTVRRNHRRSEIIALLTDRHHRREVMEEEHLDVHEMIDNVMTWIPPPLALSASPLEGATDEGAEDRASIVEVEPLLSTPSDDHAGAE